MSSISTEIEIAEAHLPAYPEEYEMYKRYSTEDAEIMGVVIVDTALEDVESLVLPTTRQAEH